MCRQNLLTKMTDEQVIQLGAKHGTELYRVTEDLAAEMKQIHGVLKSTLIKRRKITKRDHEKRKSRVGKKRETLKRKAD